MKTVVALIAFLASVALTGGESMQSMRRAVEKLGGLTEVPAVHPAPGSDESGGMKAIYYEALPWKDRPTRVFAWLGLPERAAGKVPGIVLVHGGGGSAFKEWVAKWNERGYAAISIAVEGQTDAREGDSQKGRPAPWVRHEWAGPARQGIYADSDEPLADQWMYHAVADTILANSLLRSHEKVDAEEVGLMGISWGGVITSTVLGIDGRFAFGIPTYGCGALAEADNQYGRSLGRNELYREVWDPMVRMGQATMPVLWLSWTGDQHFPLDSLSACYRAAAGAHMVAMVPDMGHGHGAGWNPPDSYAFADSIVREGGPWCRQLEVKTDGDEVGVSFLSTRPLQGATLVHTSGSGFTGRREWVESPAKLQGVEGRVVVSGTLPSGTTAWFASVRSGNLVASSDYQETR